MEVVLIGADWCAPCKMLKEYANKHDIKFSKVLDIDSESGAEFAVRYGVRGVPTVITINDNVEVGRFMGMNIDELNKLRSL